MNIKNYQCIYIYIKYLDYKYNYVHLYLCIILL